MLDGYIGEKRQKIDNDLLIHPGARIIVENARGEFLCIVRSDNGNLGLPAGGIEPNETIVECIIRETKEETGLNIQNPVVIGISTKPDLETVEYPNGDKTQYFSIEFYTNQYTGTLQLNPNEATSVAFKPTSFVAQLPVNEQMSFESLTYFRQTGQVNMR